MLNSDFGDPRLRLVRISAGSIRLRDDRKSTTWSAKILPYGMMDAPVTQSLYAEIMGRNPSVLRGENQPVESVSWLDAVHFCNALSVLNGKNPYYSIDDKAFVATGTQQADGYRLPTEAEWEFACRAGDQTPRYGPLDDIAWFKDNSKNATQAVRQKQPNSWGLFDMLGNVWEWCDDLYDVQEYGVYRVFRGGGWNDAARGCLATNRRRSHPTYAIDDLGFRIALTLGG